jgi:hypothetical protein
MTSTTFFQISSNIEVLVVSSGKGYGAAETAAGTIGHGSLAVAFQEMRDPVA